MKKMTLLLILITFVSCNPIDYDSETRLVLEGTLVNADGNPLPDQNISIEAHLDNASNSDKIASGISDSDGKFQFIVPEPKGDYYFDLVINKNSTVVQHKEFTKIRRNNFNDYRFKTNTVTLYNNSDIAVLLLELVQSDPNHFLNQITIETEEVPEYVYVTGHVDYNPFETRYWVLKNHAVTIHYNITDTTDPAHPITSNHDESFTTNSQDVFNYTINY